MKVGFISLGCSKNLIDTEVAIGHFKNNKFEIVNNPEEADIIVINTCGFIESAKEEAINTILEMAEYKEKNCKYLIAMGCLVQRYYDDLVKELPEVDLFIKIDEYPEMWQKIEKLINEDIVEKSKTKTITKISEMKPLPMPTYNEFYERVVTTGKNYAYLKIGEGCSNRCTYCAIPYIRGPFVSRRKEEIMEEARMLASKGIKELIVIAQDTTKYGVDLYGESKLRKEIPNVTLRTSLIVGFPGEKQHDFDELSQFVEEARFDKLGAFMYSKEEGTPAAQLPEQVYGTTKKSRYNKIMKIQQRISKENLQNKIGQEVEVLIEDISFDGKYLIGRTKQDVPDIDGVIYIKNSDDKLVNQFVKAKVIDVSNYDLIGEIVKEN